jgi:membrane-associated protease RseP (regulator of RpoE activity)
MHDLHPDRPEAGPPAVDRESFPPGPWSVVVRPPRPAWRTYALHALLFAATAASVYTHGGPSMVVAVLSILLTHEMGHYLACRYYRVDASLPYFIPGPPYAGLVGTFGALIRIREPIPHRRALFDIGIAGPLAGFVVCLPVLVLAALELQAVPRDRTEAGLFLGEPLLFQWAVDWVRGPLPDGMTWTAGPLGMAAWFGLLVTALNLMPIGQLDGGHVAYAVLRRRSVFISRLGLACCLALLWFRPVWLAWSVLLLVLGRRGHPPTLNDRIPLGRGRVAVSLVGVAVFLMCFTPSPIMISWRQFLEIMGLVG